MPSSDFGGSFLIGIIYLAMLAVLIKSGSQGPQAIENVSSGLSNLVNSAATGGGMAAAAYAS